MIIIRRRQLPLFEEEVHEQFDLVSLLLVRLGVEFAHFVVIRVEVGLQEELEHRDHVECRLLLRVDFSLVDWGFSFVADCLISNNQFVLHLFLDVLREFLPLFLEFRVENTVIILFGLQKVRIVNHLFELTDILLPGQLLFSISTSFGLTILANVLTTVTCTTFPLYCIVLRGPTYVTAPVSNLSNS